MLARRPFGTEGPPSAPSPLPPEALLLERLRAGDEAAFESLFQTYYQELCTFVYHFVRSRETAEELVQTTFLRVWEMREIWKPAAGVRAYLFAASRNRALNHLNHERVAQRVVASHRQDVDAASHGHDSEPDRAVQIAEISDLLRSAVADLPERRRSVVILRWQHQLSYAEIARALGISTKGVEAHVRRALAVLRERLGGLFR